MDNATIAVTGTSGLLGQRLLPLLDAHPGITRVVGLDVRDPARRVAKLDFRRVDLSSAELDPLLEGVDVLVHLAGQRDPIPDAALSERVNVSGFRRILAAAARVGVGRVVKLSSAAVYGAWEDNPIPLSEDAILRPNSGYRPALHDAECERMLAEWRRDSESRRVVVLRSAPVVGPSAVSLLALDALGKSPVTVRDAHRPIQVVHVDDMASAIMHAVEAELDGTYNVAADSWLEPDESAALVGQRRAPAVPAEVARRMMAATWSTGLRDAPPSMLPYLINPWVVANDRLKATGWRPRHSNEEAILLSTEQPGGTQIGWMVAAGAIVAGAVAASMVMRRRARLKRASRPSRR